MQYLPLATNSTNLVQQVVNTCLKLFLVSGLSVTLPKSRKYQKQNRGKAVLNCFHLNTQFNFSILALVNHTDKKMIKWAPHIHGHTF